MHGSSLPTGRFISRLLSSWNLRSSQGNTGPAGSCQAFGSSPPRRQSTPNTMQRAMQELEARGLINTQRTAGRTITEDETMIQALRQQKAQEQIAQFWAAMQKLGFTQAEALSLLKQTKENA